MAEARSPDHRKSKLCGGTDEEKPKPKRSCARANVLPIKQGPVCPSLDVIKGRKGDDEGPGLKRAKTPGKCRMGFIPEEWFLFLKPMTGVSGPYILMIGLANYAASKEILVMEHEYYLGLSVFVVVYIVSTRFGSKIGSLLDKQVDAIANDLEEGRYNQLASLKKVITDAETGIWRAEGQKDLIEAKKENIAIQLEAEFRERQMMVHKAVKRRIEYHVKRHWVSRRIKHKWMVQWILENVNKGITPEFKRKVMETAIRDLSALADKHKASQASGKT
ncbi:hypothetical protein PYW07_000317 [Mythimna separata]|uniref:ATP synthase subunit b n=1 Tax=Mythimna separata TaxID=271217 RepID=A0AAD7Z4D2_MYTSE|nr:hypothetical protein PYW07_000317 [Mythimna separata]